jgi:glycosyltransferase involved in cell wall biosynthesis
MRAELERRAAALGVAARCVRLPSMRSTAIPALMRALDVLCLPSRTRANWKEQFGRVLIEAMASGAVPLGSSSGEIPRVIADGGLIFPEGDVDALAARLAELERDAALRATLAARGLARVRAEYAQERIAGKFGAAFRLAASRALYRHGNA